VLLVALASSDFKRGPLHLPLDGDIVTVYDVAPASPPARGSGLAVTVGVSVNQRRMLS